MEANVDGDDDAKHKEIEKKEKCDHKAGDDRELSG